MGLGERPWLAPSSSGRCQISWRGISLAGERETEMEGMGVAEEEDKGGRWKEEDKAEKKSWACGGVTGRTIVVGSNAAHGTGPMFRRCPGPKRFPLV